MQIPTVIGTYVKILTCRDPFTWNLSGHSIAESKADQVGSSTPHVSGNVTFNILATSSISHYKTSSKHVQL